MYHSRHKQSDMIINVVVAVGGARDGTTYLEVT